MMEPTGTLIGGLFALACTMQDVDPLLQTAIGKPHTLSYVARDGEGAMIGWLGLKGDEKIEARRYDDGVVRLTGASFKDGGAPTWAELRKSTDGADFDIDWFMYDQPSKNGKATAAIWSKGRCEQLANQKEAIQ